MSRGCRTGRKPTTAAKPFPQLGSFGDLLFGWESKQTMTLVRMAQLSQQDTRKGGQSHELWFVSPCFPSCIFSMESLSCLPRPCLLAGYSGLCSSGCLCCVCSLSFRECHLL